MTFSFILWLIICMSLHTYYSLYIIGSQSNYTVVIDGFFYIIIHYMVIISLHIDMLCIIVSSQTNYTVVIDTFLYHSPLHCYHIVMFTVFCITLFTIQYISFMNQY